MRAVGREPAAAAESGSAATEAQAGGREQLSDAQVAYQALRASGKTHQQIVEELTQHVLRTIAAMDEKTQLRSTETETF
jgi:hypothetical protein